MFVEVIGLLITSRFAEKASQIMNTIIITAINEIIDPMEDIVFQIV